MRCKGGEVIELISDLGGGKTTFVRGLAAGLGSPDSVASPSFTLSREYKAADKTLYHFDFYRLSDPGLVANELAEVVGNPQAVVAVEWADIVEDVLPAAKLTIRLTNTGESERKLEFSAPETLKYLLPENT
ncbi:MAG TPA: tRNA (adenosine(37)-N6)-threonylcarbamoyltransferase complex ATPase subunit type 1 TsaE [Candidatus Saccharimonadales bacterium]|nr:tRNA (adenosine(37)-N6)-threonylcarbamoyltransferase complex ATPase subunit type 1 TsaE [Candidatus Saccharimonadales bacterium]